MVRAGKLQPAMRLTNAGRKWVWNSGQMTAEISLRPTPDPAGQGGAGGDAK
jgi:hypothetical protein